jgi:hypothetical protein
MAPPISRIAFARPSRRSLTERSYRDLVSMELGADRPGHDAAQFRQIATRHGFVCDGGANAPTRHKLTSILDHLTENGVD